jgi:hypothetical protein
MKQRLGSSFLVFVKSVVICFFGDNNNDCCGWDEVEGSFPWENYACVESDRFYCFLLFYVMYTRTLDVRILFRLFISGVPAYGTVID